MKKLIALFALVLSTSAMAGTVYVDGNDSANLQDCGGSVRTSIDNDNTQLNLVFSNVANCSRFDILSANGDRVNYPLNELDGQNPHRYGSRTIPGRFIDVGRNQIRVQIRSISGRTSDTIVITVRARSTQPTPPRGGSHGSVSMTSRDEADLRACGGSVRTTVTGNGNGRQLNLVFRDVANCSRFDIISANGSRVNYDMQELDGQNPNRHGSRTIPSRFIDWGFNYVTIKLRSVSGQTSETIRVNFLAF